MINKIIKSLKILLKEVPYAGRLIEHLSLLRATYPRVINIEVTTSCNARCNYCGREKIIKTGLRPVRHMDIALFQKILQDIKTLDYLPDRIVPVGLGDPMLYPELPTALKMIKKELPNYPLQVTTNGVSFPERLQDALIDLEIDSLVVSINFHSRELYKLHNGVDKLDTVVSNTLGFLRKKRNRKPAVTVQILDIKENSQDIRAFKLFWKCHKNKIDRVLVRPLNDFGGTIEARNFIDVKKIKRRYPCSQIFYQLMINVDGYCFPCCMGITASNDDSLSIGNIKEQSIKELYDPCARIHTIRKIHVNSDYEQLPKCKICNTWSYNPNMFLYFRGRWR